MKKTLKTTMKNKASKKMPNVKDDHQNVASNNKEKTVQNNL